MNETKTNSDNDIIVSFEDVKMKDFRDYWQAVAKGDWQGQDTFFAKVVKSWSFEGDPGDVSIYSGLTLKEYFHVQQEIRKASQLITQDMQNKRG